MSEPNYPPPPPPSPPPPTAPPPPAGGAPAAQQVQGPAIGLLITGVIGVVFSLLGLLMNALGMGMSGLEDLGGGPADQYMRYMSGGLGIVSGIIALAISGFVIWAALQMRQLRNWNMAVAASIVAMIPCIGPCCVIGIPIGIWAIVILMRPEVKAAFTG